ncbi:MAG: hypothetical protein AAF684_04200, partial [Pseudomonadota bacterium]
NLIWLLPAGLVVLYGVSRLADGVGRTVMAVVALVIFAGFLLFMAIRVPSPDLIFFLSVAVAMAAYDFFWSTKHGKN